ncbi:MAG: ACP S-malonyltransferase [Rickettsiales bacterium]|jgi:[acyl-carrier-protein] S-malonyltransferase|nr:ACP S-malonyltransferase [Rickettsiales bacterium]
MSKCFIFPGQGSQAVGMGRDLYDANPAARAVFDAVNDALNMKLTDIIFNGPMEDLTLTANVQPAIFAVSMAMWAAAGFTANNDDFIAGHSLGEYSALCAAGAMSIADTARLLRLRGVAMQEAVPVGTGLVAVVLGLEFDAVNQICADAGCEIANDNGAGQFVISGLKETVERAMELALAAGAKRAMPLALSAPVHCRLQEPTAARLAAALADIEVKTPAAKFISNQTAAVLSDPDGIRAELAYQITHGVRWRESVQNMPALGITETIEVGPGSVLSGLVKRINPNLEAKHV